jgi:hypothetical protein
LCVNDNDINHVHSNSKPYPNISPECNKPECLQGSPMTFALA